MYTSCKKGVQANHPLSISSIAAFKVLQTVTVCTYKLVLHRMYKLSLMNKDSSTDFFCK